MKRYESSRGLLVLGGGVGLNEDGQEAGGAPIDFDAKFLWQVTITVADIEPPIWRRLLLPEDLNFAQLHEVIQAAFGWTDSHLHQFVIGGIVVGAPEFDEDGNNRHRTFNASEVFLRDLVLHNLGEAKILYEYDFGDHWCHWITFDSELPGAAGESYPLLIDGRRSAPPEDVGGPRGYADFLEAWHDPEHEDHRAMRRWVGRRFDPEAFDREKTQKAIRSALRRCRGNYRFRRES
ncbi:MAG: plasmid pRiA4b ORF-3 family protein [Acetobacteraceae bacterium]|nr:plasmid pRiA4b ORF-3 family protein [Acetobacteraceae bacterium]